MMPTRGINKRMIVLSLIWVGLFIFEWPQVQADGDEPSRDDAELPSLWYAAQMGSYHVLYQLEMKGSIELIEEWADFNARLFRLDLVKTGGARTSFLTNGHTREMFRYSPFQCAHSNGSTMFPEMSLIAPLFVGHVWDDHQEAKEAYFAYGLGPLWLRASKDAKKIDKSASDFVDQSWHPFEDHFEKYQVEFAPELTDTQQPLRLNFYFLKSGRPEFVDTVDWILSEVSSDGKIKQQKHQVRAKVLQVDYKNEVDAAVFKIPVGYGCSRKQELDPTLQLDVGQVLLHQGAPNQATFEVTTSYPNEDALQAASWTSHKFSLRVLRLTQPRVGTAAKTESYFVTLAQFRDLPEMMSGQTGANNLKDNLKPIVATRARTKRIKRVWWAPDSDQGQATVYTIDQSTGECVVDHQDVRNQVLLTLGGGDGASSEAASSINMKPMVLSLDQISVLFDDYSGYHLIDEGEQFGEASANKFRNRFYEKRLHHFELKSTDGSLAWSGPVSIVKQISTYAEYLDTFEDRWMREKRSNANSGPPSGSASLNLAQDYKTKLVIFFYADKLDRILFKVVIDLLDNHEVSFSYANQQMDVSSCFRLEDKQDIILKYPLESVELSRKLESKRETIKLLLGDGLFWSQGSFLTPLHVYNIQPSFDPFYMRLQVSLLNLPLTHTFQMERGLKLEANSGMSWTDTDKALIEVGASSAELCGQHCEFYNCFRFSYDLTTRSCRLELDPAKTKTVECATCELYTYFDRRLPASQEANSKWPASFKALVYRLEHERPHLSSDAIIELFEELVEEAQSGNPDDSNPNPLVLHVNMKPELDSIRHPALEDDGQFIGLWPSAIEHNVETMNEYSRELLESDEGSTNEESKVIRVRGDKRLRLEFTVLLKDRSFTVYNDKVLTGVTYEGCEQHCELNDCRSFAYCMWDETCLVSGQHNEKYLRANSMVTHETRGCNIYILNYLSKFEPYGVAPEPARDEVMSTEVALSETDCATACMDHQGFSCQSFYFCHQPPTTLAPEPSAVCLLTKLQHNDVNFDHDKVKGELMETSSSDSDSSRKCSLFMRSRLAQFDKYFGKKINMNERETKLSVIGSLEDCASYCLRSKCLAFDVCPTNHMFGSQMCEMVVDSIKRSQLLPEKKCTTFVLADKSHFNLHKLDLIYNDDNHSPPGITHETNEQTLGKPDKEADIDDGEPGETQPSPAKPDDELKLEEDLAGAQLEILEEYERNQWRRHNLPDVAGHGWLARLFSLTLGIILGVGLILGWNEAYARGWLSRTRTTR